MEPSSDLVEKDLYASPFKDIYWILKLKLTDFHTAYGYSLLEHLITQKDNIALVQNIWDFFENDLHLKEQAKQMKKLELFIYFKRLLSHIYLEEISSLNDLREIICAKDYWLKSIKFYFSIASPLESIQVSVILYNENIFQLQNKNTQYCPLILLACINEQYFPTALEDYPLQSNSDFPLAFYYSLDLAKHLNEPAAGSVYICQNCNSPASQFLNTDAGIFCQSCLNL